MDYYRQNEAKIIHAQAIWRGKLARTQYQNLSTSCLAASAFAQGPQRRAVPCHAAPPSHLTCALASPAAKPTVRSDKPTVSTVQRFLHLLDDSDKDFDEEIGTPTDLALSARPRLIATSSHRVPGPHGDWQSWSG